MEIDTEKVDEAVLALLYLTLHDGPRAWKGFDWDTLNRLHAKGLISNPVGKAKAVAVTEEGVREAERFSSKLFEKRAPGLFGRRSWRSTALLPSEPEFPA